MTWQTKINSLRTDSRVVVSAASALSFAAGGTVAYFVTKKKLETKFANLADEEIEQAKRYYGDIHEKQREYNPQELIEELKKDGSLIIEKDEERTDLEQQLDEKYGVEEYTEYNKLAKPYSPIPDYDELEKDEPVKNPEEFRKEPPTDEDGKPDYTNINIFDDIPDVTLDKDQRDPLQPYIIDKDEFMENEPEHTQTTITYFEGDDVLVDERDQPITDKNKTVGETHLEQFGLGSGDDNVVYVRNETLEVDFEICHSDGKYTEEVLGFIEHSDRRPKIRKFRGDDE